MAPGSLVKQALKGMAFLIIALWLLLFIPAWSLDFTEAWAYWITFSVLVVVVTAWFLRTDPRLIESRIKSGPAAEKEKSQKIIQGITGTAFVLLMIIPGLDHRFGWSHLPFSVAIAGDLLLALGFLIVFLTFRENSYTSAIIEVREGQAVISTGPYAVVRHPMYVGGDLIVLATPFALGSLPALLPAIVIVAGIAWRILEEEKYLAENLPGYTEYRLKTRFRLIPFIW